jgi:hypothetical protein
MNLKGAVGSHEAGQKRMKNQTANPDQITCRVNENSSSGFLPVLVFMSLRRIEECEGVFGVS